MRNPVNFQQKLTCTTDIFVHFLHDLFHGEAGRFHARREFVKGFHEARHKSLSGIQQVDMIDHPIVVCVRSYIGSFVWIGAQVEKIGHTQGGKGFLPDLQRTGRSLFGKDQFPIVVADGG